MNGEVIYSTNHIKLNDEFYLEEKNQSTPQNVENIIDYNTHSEVSQSKVKESNSYNHDKLRQNNIKVFHSNLLDKFSQKNKPIHQIRGDQKPLGEMDEIYLSKNFAININLKTVINPKRSRMSELILSHFSKEEFKILKERAPTPHEEKSKPGAEEDQMIKSFKKTYTSKMLNSTLRKSVSKIYKIITDDQSTIKLPSDCNLYFLKQILDTTDDFDLKSFCDLINEPTTGKWKTVSSESTIQIYKKNVIC